MTIRSWFWAAMLLGVVACDTEGTECDADDDCNDGQECGAIDCSSDTAKVCFVPCDSDSDCEENSGPGSHCASNPLPDCFDYCSGG
jgi:hypothetical protein